MNRTTGPKCPRHGEHCRSKVVEIFSSHLASVIVLLSNKLITLWFVIRPKDKHMTWRFSIILLWQAIPSSANWNFEAWADICDDILTSSVSELIPSACILLWASVNVYRTTCLNPMCILLASDYHIVMKFSCLDLRWWYYLNKSMTRIVLASCNHSEVRNKEAAVKSKHIQTAVPPGQFRSMVSSGCIHSNSCRFICLFAGELIQI